MLMNVMTELYFDFMRASQWSQCVPSKWNTQRMYQLPRGDTTIKSTFDSDSNLGPEAPVPTIQWFLAWMFR